MSWQNQLLGIGRWMVLAVGPAFALFLAWNLIGKIDPDGQLHLHIFASQFAVVCFLRAAFSGVAAPGEDGLSSVAKIGENIFGWGKSKG